MPKEPEGWSDEQLEKIDKWLDEKWGKDRAPCRQCEQSVWQIAKWPTNLLLGDVRGNTDAGNSYPSVAIVCGNCGNQILLNGFILGLYPPKGKEAGNG